MTQAPSPGFEPITIAGQPVLRRPGSGDSPPQRAAFIFLHDLDPTPLWAWADFAPGLTLLAPLGGASLWSPRPCPAFDPQRSAEAYLLNDLLPWCCQRFTAVAIGGVGIGGQAALRLAFQHPARLPIVASLEGWLDLHELYGHGSPLDTLYERAEQVRQDTPILFVRPPLVPRFVWLGCPPDSPQSRGHDRLVGKLQAVGVPVTHRIAAFPSLRREMAEFLQDALLRQSRRLLD